MPGSSQNRRQIVDAANRLFYHRGYNQTSFSDIAEAADIPRGNFYYYFKTKDDILNAVVEDRIERIKTMLAEWNRSHADAGARLRQFLKMVRDAGKDLARYGCPIGSLNIELGKAQPMLKSKSKKMFDLFSDWLAAQFRTLGHRDAEALALHLLGRAQGIAVIAQVYANRSHLNDELDALESWLQNLTTASRKRRGGRLDLKNTNL